MIFSKAEAYERSGRADLAIEEYDAIIDRHEGGVDALMHRAKLRRETGDLIGAEADLERAAAMAPDDPYPLMRLGQLGHNSGRNIKAAQWQGAALTRAPDSPEMRVNAAAAYSHNEWLDLAYAAAKPLREGLPDWWAAARQRALDRYPAERAAALALLRTRRTANDQVEVHWTLLQMLYRLGRLRLSKRLCEELMRDRPHSFPAFAFYARILARQSGPEAAATFLDALEWLHGGNPEYIYVLARMCQEAGRYKDVVRLSSIIPIEQQNDDLRYTTLIATMLLGHGEDLTDYCRAWSRLSPTAGAPPGILCSAHFRAELGQEPQADIGIETVTLFHFWDKPDVPDDVRTVLASWTHYHPTARQRLFNEEDARDYLRCHYGAGAVATFDRCTHAAMKADIFRVAYLAQDGGVWVDADEFCTRPVPELLAAAAASDTTAVLSGDVPAYLHNFFLGALPGSKTMRAAVEEALAAVEAHAGEGRRPNIWEVTGPGLVTRAVGRRLEQGGGAEPGAIRLLALTHYRSFATNRSDLDYKSLTEGNWQLL